MRYASNRSDKRQYLLRNNYYVSLLGTTVLECIISRLLMYKWTIIYANQIIHLVNILYLPTFLKTPYYTRLKLITNYMLFIFIVEVYSFINPYKKVFFYENYVDTVFNKYVSLVRIVFFFSSKFIILMQTLTYKLIWQ